MEAYNPDRHPRRPNGTNAAKIQSQSRQNAGGRRHTVCPLLVASIRDICKDQIRRGNRSLGRRNITDSHSDSSMVGRFQLMHQPDPVRIFQQKIQKGLHGYSKKQEMLRQTSLLRNSGFNVIKHVNEEIVALSPQQHLHKPTISTGTRRCCSLLHLQQHRCLILYGYDVDGSGILKFLKPTFGSGCDHHWAPQRGGQVA